MCISWKIGEKQTTAKVFSFKILSERKLFLVWLSQRLFDRTFHPRYGNNNYVVYLVEEFSSIAKLKAVVCRYACKVFRATVIPCTSRWKLYFQRKLRFHLLDDDAGTYILTTLHIFTFVEIIRRLQEKPWIFYLGNDLFLFPQNKIFILIIWTSESYKKIYWKNIRWKNKLHHL